MDLKGKSVCVIILRTMGDVANSIPFFAGLKEMGAKVTATTFEDYWKLLKNHADDFILTLDEKLTKSNLITRIHEHIRIILEIRKRKPEVIFDITDSDRTTLFSLFSGGYKIASATKYSYRKFFYNEFHVENTHTAKRFLSLIGGMNAPIKIDAIKPEFNNYAVIHYGAGAKNRFWDYEKFKKLAEILSKNLNVVIIGDRDENDFKEFIDLRGKLEIEKLTGIIKHAKIFIGADSGPLQIAEILKTKSIGMFGPGDPAEWAINSIVIKKNLPCVPCKKNRCRYKIADCMRYIEVEDVVDAIGR